MVSTSDDKRPRLLDPLPVRFQEQTGRRLRAASKRFRLTTSEIIRKAVEAKLPEWERDGVMIIGEDAL